IEHPLDDGRRRQRAATGRALRPRPAAAGRDREQRQSPHAEPSARTCRPRWRRTWKYDSLTAYDNRSRSRSLTDMLDRLAPSVAMPRAAISKSFATMNPTRFAVRSVAARHDEIN